MDIAKFSTVFSFPHDLSRPKVFLIFCDFHYSRHVPGPTVCISHFSCFSIFLIIFHYLMSLILIFCVFQFSRHISGPTVCISYISRFQWFRHFSNVQMDISHFPWFWVFLPYSISYMGHL
jgi:hypothetical protein